MQRKPTLGRGLADLLGTRASPPPPLPAATPSGDELARLPLDVLQRGRYQPRTDMRAEALAELAESIKAQGIVQPIVVRPLAVTPGSQETQRYEIIAGERRWRAAQMAETDGHPGAAYATFPTKPPSRWRSSRTSSART